MRASASASTLQNPGSINLFHHRQGCHRITNSWFHGCPKLSRHGISLLTVCKVERLKLHVAPGRGSVCCHSRFLQPLCKPLLSLCSVLSSLLLSLFTLGPRSRALAVSQSSSDKVHLATYLQSSPNGKRRPDTVSGACAWAGRGLFWSLKFRAGSGHEFSLTTCCRRRV